MTAQEFLAGLDAGLHFENLDRLTRGLSDLIKSTPGANERVVAYYVQAVLSDTGTYWIGTQAVETALLRQIEKTLIPPIRAVFKSLSKSPEDQFRAMDALTTAYFSLHPEFGPMA